MIKVPDILIELDYDTVEDIIPELLKMGLIKNRSEFLSLLSKGCISLSGENLYSDDLSYVLSNDDILIINKNPVVRIIK